MRLVVLIFLLAANIAFGQKKVNTDSLFLLLDSKKVDTVQYDANMRLGNWYYKLANDSALIYYSTAQSIANQLKDTLRLIYVANSYIAYYKRNNDYSKAIQYSHDALTLSEAINDTIQISGVYQRKGRLFLDVGKEKEAIKYTKISADLVKNIDDYKYGFRLFLIAWYMFNTGDKEGALDYFKQSLVVHEREGNIGRANEMKGWLGNTYNSLGQTDLALKYRKENLAFHINRGKEKGRRENKHSVGEGYRYLSYVYTNMHQYDTAIVLLEKSFEKFREAGNINRSSLMLYSIASNYNKLENYPMAAKYLDKLFAPENNYTDLLSLTLGNQLASTVYEKVGKPEQALSSLRTYIVLQDSMDKSEHAAQVLQGEMAFQLEKEQQRLEMEQDKRDAVAQEEIRRQKTVGYSLMGGLGLLVVMILLVYRNLLQKKKTNKVIVTQHKQLAEKNKEVVDSINYAKRIQQAILPISDEVEALFEDSFVFYLPRDIVSGDFYWITENDDYKTVVVADCTGHGVPGGFMSMLGFEMLQDIAMNSNVENTAEMLQTLDKRVVETLNKPGTGQEYHDGMDALVCMFSKKEKKLRYSGANRPLIRVRNGEIEEFKPNKYSIGGAHDSSTKLFHQHEIPYESGDCFYLYSDGYQDQFGGPKGKKFMHRQLKSLLSGSSTLPMNKQKEAIENAYFDWKKDLEQVDDVCMVGVKM